MCHQQIMKHIEIALVGSKRITSKGSIATAWLDLLSVGHCFGRYFEPSLRAWELVL